MNLSLITEETKSHYVLMKDFNKFVSSNKTQGKKALCMFCLQCFSSEEILTNHKEN